ncbi:MAG: type 1 glutamine amidotransferase [Spirochaetes bacterium]|nr:type 1 glutamine amidotransferase [Spirochaetota bacterium]
MKLHYLQHVEFENLSGIQKWADKRKIKISYTKFYQSHEFPDINNIDLLIILGGPMSVNEDRKYKWLKEEKKYIEKAIQNNKKVFGICLGAQLIADVLGSRAYKNKYKEIGWFPVFRKNVDLSQTAIKNFPDELIAFHWHGDTFDTPKDAVCFAESEACSNQGFIYNNNILALQFHIESTLKSINSLIKNCKNELTKDKFVQNEKEILISSKKFLLHANRLLFDILDNVINEKMIIY